MIDPRALLTFRAICRSGSITGAARALNLSQPSVSNQIAQLERRLGVVLFERSRTGISLTPEGEALARRADGLAILLRDAASDVQHAHHHVAGPLRLGGTPGALVTLLPGAIARLDARIGEFALSLQERPDHLLLEMLRQDEIELAFVTTGIDQVPSDMVEIECLQDPFVLLVGAAHDGLPDSVSLHDLEHLAWVMPEARGAFRRQVDALFVAAGVALPRVTIRSDSLLTTRAIVRETARVTVLPRTVALDDGKSAGLRVIAIREAQQERTVGLRHRADAALSPLAQAMIDVLRQDA
ncbi:LysR family transcriptional regulator [Novosphingobium profundi]|nr:LysR family transcriptional regulator [Novosphingobium profundi]